MAYRNHLHNLKCLPSMHKAFTLVELLVVIAIISVLAGMLMPALENAIESSRAISCRNNLKQFGIVNEMYLDDYNRYYPQYWNLVPGKTGNTAWWRMYEEYDIEVSWLYKNYVNSGHIPQIHCPTLLANIVYTYNDNQAWCYGINNVLLGTNNNSLTKVSECALMADDKGGQMLSKEQADINGWAYDSPSTRHADNANILFCDIHVEAMTMDEIPYSKNNEVFWTGK